MYQQQITTPEEAISHLFFHCCLQDGVYTDRELEALSDKMVLGGLNKKLNFKDEVVKYRAYYDDIKDDEAYIRFLIEFLKPGNTLALYSYCAELCLTDALLGPREGKLLRAIANALHLKDNEEAVCRTLMLQRKAVEMRKIF
jgi:uncharacterized tellurite resistance protein B-like protein